MPVIKDISLHLNNHDIKPSVQRIKIYQYLMATNVHPTVDMIYHKLSQEIPTLSKTTVYNTLKLFLSKGIAMIVNIEDNETRYDWDTSFHGHFKCNNCKQVYDFPITKNQLNSTGLKGFTVMESHYYLKGICKSCTEKSNNIFKN